MSLSLRRAWIEIQHTLHDFHAPKVALLAESVDRNIQFRKLLYPGRTVALLAESVDRNLSSVSDSLPALVALLAESVDRNFVLYH